MSARVLGLVVATVITLTPSAASGERIVAVGDIHGDFEALVEILQVAEIIDENHDWSGGRTTFVQTGDYLDRGPQMMQVMDLLMALETQAEAAGGRVEVLLGNHEGTNLLGELQDVSAESLSYFSAQSSQAARDAEYSRALKATKKRLAMAGLPRPLPRRGDKKAWMDRHPTGLLPYLESMGPDGKYGRWLRQRPIVTKIGDSLFLHGGLNTDFARWSIEDLNAKAWDELARADRCRQVLTRNGLLSVTASGVDLIQGGNAYLGKLRKKSRGGDLKTAEERDALEALERCEDYQQWFLLRADGPLWFRGYSAPRTGLDGWTDEDGPQLIARVLEAQRARHTVTGHTIQDQARIVGRFGGRVFLIDTGMLSALYNGRASALEIEDGLFTAIYPDQEIILWQEPAARLGAAAGTLATGGAPAIQSAATRATAPEWIWMGRTGPVAFRNEDALLEFLRRAKIVSTKVLETGTNETLRVELERDGIQLRAAFRFVDIEWRNKQGPGGRFYRLFRDRYIYESAAYTLSRVLGLDRVPPTVLRRYRARSGSIQAWVENASMLPDIEERGEPPPDPASWARQTIDQKLFDTLVNNRDRNAGNSLIDGNWKVWLIDHTRTFLIDPDPQRIEGLGQASRSLWQHLRSADHGAVEQQLRPFLSQQERRALFDRWDAIIEHFEDEIAQRGESAVLFD